MINPLASLPYLGVGIGLREKISKETEMHRNLIDAVEVITENYFPLHTQPFLHRFAQLLPVIPHGIELSVGSAEHLETSFLKKIKEICALLKASYYSDHFAVTRLGETHIGHLSPIWFTKEALGIVVDKVNQVQDFLGIPLALENITSTFDIPFSDITESEFIAEVCHRTQCGLLLDITNVHINAYNQKNDPYLFLQGLPMDHVIQIHLAGGTIRNNYFYDSHSQELGGANERVWPLLEWVLPRTPHVKAVIIERDGNFKESFKEMFDRDLERARELVKKLHPNLPRENPMS